MAKLSTEELLSAFEELTLIELSEFVKAFEEKFDVTAAAPVAVAAAGAPAAAGEAAEEKTEFDVVLESAGEAKALVDGAPKAVLEGVAKEAADDAKAKLEEAGASVTVK
jgi:large subunit ribosomal protein L7/L12